MIRAAQRALCSRAPKPADSSAHTPTFPFLQQGMLSSVPGGHPKSPPRDAGAAPPPLSSTSPADLVPEMNEGMPLSFDLITTTHLPRLPRCPCQDPNFDKIIFALYGDVDAFNEAVRPPKPHAQRASSKSSFARQPSRQCSELTVSFCSAFRIRLFTQSAFIFMHGWQNFGVVL